MVIIECLLYLFKVRCAIGKITIVVIHSKYCLGKLRETMRLDLHSSNNKAVSQISSKQGSEVPHGA